MAGNIIRIKPDERIDLSTEKHHVVDFSERNGKPFTISSGTWDLIRKSDQTDKVTARSLAILTPATSTQGDALTGDTDEAGEFLLVMRLTLSTGEQVTAIQDWIIEDAIGQALIS